MFNTGPQCKLIVLPCLNKEIIIIRLVISWSYMRPLFLLIDEERLLSTEYRGVDRSTQETVAGFEHQLNHMYLYAKTKRNLLILWSFSTLGSICWAAVIRLKYCQYGVKHYPTNLFFEENVLFDFNENMAVFLYKCTSILFSNYTMELTTDFIFFHSKVQWKSTNRSQSRWKSSTSCIFNKKQSQGTHFNFLYAIERRQIRWI